MRDMFRTGRFVLRGTLARRLPMNDHDTLSDAGVIALNLETRCLLSLLQYSVTVDADLHSIAEKTIELVPTAWPPGTDVRVQIVLDDGDCLTDGVRDERQTLRAPIEFDRHHFGQVSIGYYGSDPVVAADFIHARGPRILDAVAIQLGQAAYRFMVNAELRESEHRHRVMTEFSPVGLIRTDGKGQIIDCNRAAATLFGTTEAQLKGLNCLDEVTDSGLREVIPLALQGQLAEHEGLFTPLNLSSRKYLRVVASPVETPTGSSEAIATLEDISARKAGEAAVIASRLSLAEAQRIAHVGSWEFDMARQELVASDECKRIFEVDPSIEILKPADVFSFFRADFREVIEARLKASTEPGTPGLLYSHVSLAFPDGREKWIDIHSEVEKDDLGIPKRLFGIVHDVTDEHQNQVELREARDQAEAACNARADFMANMSHEIRTPLNAIIGMTALVLDSRLSDKQRDYLTKIESASKSLLNIVDDILDFSRIEGHQLRISSVDFSPEDVIGDVIDVNELRASEKGLYLHAEIDPEVPATIRGDPLRLSQILNNLVGNAIKFTERGDVILKLSLAGPVTADAPLLLRFDVSDTGIGMAAEQVANLFHPFSQGDTSTTRPFGGTGMGLAISRQICRLMEGAIRAESLPGKGSTFTVELPFGIVDARPSGTLEPGAPLPPSSVRILVVDDDEIDRGILARQLSSLSFDVETAVSGKDAVSAVIRAESGHRSFGIVFVSTRARGSDGIDIGRMIGAASKAKPPMVLATSAFMFSDEMQNRAGRFFFGLLFKPILPKQLARCLNRVISGSPHATSPAIRHSFKFEGAHVLLVEDNRVNQQVALELLRKTGVRVSLAENGREAVQMMDQGHFDLVLMDIQMPGMDGLEATRLIRRLDNPAAASVPIIAMTAHGMGQHIQKSLESGMNGHITKPVEPESLFATLSRWLGGSRTEVKTEQPVRREMAEPKFRHDLHVPGLNVGKGLGYVGGNIELYKKLLKKFVEEYEGKDVCLEAAAVNNHPDEARRFVHSMKSLAGTLGAVTLQEKAATLEKALMDNDYFQHGLIDAFRSQLGQLFSSLRNLPELFGGVEPEISRQPSTQKVDVPAVVLALKSSLRKLQPTRSHHYMGMLASLSWPADIAAEIKRAVAAMKGYRFHEALEILELIEPALMDLTGDANQ